MLTLNSSQSKRLIDILQDDCDDMGIRKIASLTKMSTGYLCQVVNGENPILAGSAFQICMGLWINVNYVLIGEWPKYKILTLNHYGKKAA